jgi:hypothetical protein
VVFDRVYDTDADLWETLTDPKRLRAGSHGSTATCARAAGSPSTSTTTTCPSAGSPPATPRVGTAGSGRTPRILLVSVASNPPRGRPTAPLPYPARRGARRVRRRLTLPAPLDELVAGREVRDTWSEDWSSAHEVRAARLADGQTSASPELEDPRGAAPTWAANTGSALARSRSAPPSSKR